MDKKLDAIIRTSTFEVQDGRFVYVKVSKLPNFSKHFMVSQDKDEITVVTKEENIKELDLIEKNKDYWNLIALNVSAPFYSVGFLAKVSSAIARENMNILIVSTYSKDYIMVRKDKIKKAKKVLLQLGFKEK